MDWLSILGIVAFLIIGIAIILFITKIIWFLLPAAIVGLVVFLLTFDLYWAGIAFVAVAIISMILKLKRQR
jgi:membrane protein implicated in regulation of membrane protease activity